MNNILQLSGTNRRGQQLLVEGQKQANERSKQEPGGTAFVTCAASFDYAQYNGCTVVTVVGIPIG